MMRHRPSDSTAANTGADMDRFMAGAEHLGVIGSPSSTTELALDILGAAARRKLVGELALFGFNQDGTPHYAIGQITEVQLRNIWHEDPTMRSLIRQRGRVDAVSERQDTHLGKQIISAVFKDSGNRRYEPSILGTVPSTGTPIQLVTDDILHTLLKPYEDQLFYLGHVYGSKPKLPMWFKHFHRGPQGAGEAYHIGIFGKTGSGKSVLAKKIMLAYARHPGMALLVIDPQGEFAREIEDGGPWGEFALPMKRLFEHLGRKPVVLSIRNLILDRWQLFEKILFDSPFFQQLTVRKPENRRSACQTVVNELRKRKIPLRDIYLDETFETVWELLAEDRVQQMFFQTSVPRKRFADALANADAQQFLTYWKAAGFWFWDGRRRVRTVDRALSWLLANPEGSARGILIIDLSEGGALPDTEGSAGYHFRKLPWNERIQALILRRLLEELTQHAEMDYLAGTSLNTLVVIDEAHRLAPKDQTGRDEEAEAVRQLLIDAARTTRKYGLGWMFISQTLSSIHPEIIQQMRIYFFGFGLALGREFQSLTQLAGGAGESLKLYKLFRDPHSAFDAASREYSFMTVGPVSPLSFSGIPLFFNAFNTADAFLQANGFPPGATEGM